MIFKKNTVYYYDKYIVNNNYFNTISVWLSKKKVLYMYLKLIKIH